MTRTEAGGTGLIRRVLPEEPYRSLSTAVAAGAGRGLDAARQVDADVIIAELEASGLRGRGGAGFPTGTKWRTVRENASAVIPTTVVVNGAEGEPSTFKDRAILRSDPYSVIEGALIAATVLGADEAIIAVKDGTPELETLRAAAEEVIAAGWTKNINLVVFAGPADYLYGEETALLEVIDGREPLPRIAPPFRRGVDEVIDLTSEPPDPDTNNSAGVEMADPDRRVAPPTLVNNVETMANVPKIVVEGAKWFRSVGTEKSPGSIVCTFVGAVARPGVGEVPLGTTLREAIDLVGLGPVEGSSIRAVLPGAAGALLSADQLDTPLTYEDMTDAGSTLGAGGFLVLDRDDDIAALAAGVSRFLADESCAQCTPCKEDGTAMAELLAKIAASEGSSEDVDAVRSRVATVANESRCYLATQHQVVVGSILERFLPELEAHLVESDAIAPATEPWDFGELKTI